MVPYGQEFFGGTMNMRHLLGEEVEGDCAVPY